MRFAEVMAARADAELIEIATSSSDEWQPDAIAAAKAELTQRGVSVGTHPFRGPYQADLSRTVRKVPLDRGMTVLAFALGGVGSILGVLIALVVVATWKSKNDPRDGGRFILYAVVGAVISLVLVRLL